MCVSWDTKACLVPIYFQSTSPCFCSASWSIKQNRLSLRNTGLKIIWYLCIQLSLIKTQHSRSSKLPSAPWTLSFPDEASHLKLQVLFHELSFSICDKSIPFSVPSKRDPFCGLLTTQGFPLPSGDDRSGHSYQFLCAVRAMVSVALAFHQPPKRASCLQKTWVLLG